METGGDMFLFSWIMSRIVHNSFIFLENKNRRIQNLIKSCIFPQNYDHPVVTRGKRGTLQSKVDKLRN